MEGQQVTAPGPGAIDLDDLIRCVAGFETWWLSFG